MKPHVAHYYVDLGDLGEIEVEVTYNFTPGQPGKLSGPWEDSYPATDPDIEVLSVNPDIAGKIADHLESDEAFYSYICELHDEEDCEE